MKPALAEALRDAGTRADGDTALELALARHRITELEDRLDDVVVARVEVEAELDDPPNRQARPTARIRVIFR